MQPTTYRISGRGQLTERLGSAFEVMSLEAYGGQTILVGEIRDQSHLYGVLDRVRNLGLELVPWKRPGDCSGRRGDGAMTGEYDVITIGRGPAGEHAADSCTAADLTTLVNEAKLVGGECSYRACMPSKTLPRPRRCLLPLTGPQRGADGHGRAGRECGAGPAELDDSGLGRHGTDSHAPFARVETNAGKRLAA